MNDDSLVWWGAVIVWSFFYYCCTAGVRAARHPARRCSGSRSCATTAATSASARVRPHRRVPVLVPVLRSRLGGRCHRARAPRPGRTSPPGSVVVYSWAARGAAAVPRQTPSLSSGVSGAAEPEVAGRAVEAVAAARADAIPPAVATRGTGRSRRVSRGGSRCPGPVGFVAGECGRSRGRTSRRTTPTRCRSCCRDRSRSAERGDRRGAEVAVGRACSRSGTFPATRSCGAHRRARGRRPTETRRGRVRRAPRTPTPLRSAAARPAQPRTPSASSTTRE